MQKYYRYLVSNRPCIDYDENGFPIKEWIFRFPNNRGLLVYQSIELTCFEEILWSKDCMKFEVSTDEEPLLTDTAAYYKIEGLIFADKVFAKNTWL